MAFGAAIHGRSLSQRFLMVLAEVLVGGFVAAVTGAAVTVDVSPAAPHSSVAPLLVASPL